MFPFLINPATLVEKLTEFINEGADSQHIHTMIGQEALLTPRGIEFYPATLLQNQCSDPVGFSPYAN